MEHSESFGTQQVSMDFDGVRAVDRVELVLRKGEILGLIGPNGAGKTTLVNIMTGLLRPTEGRIVLNGVDVTGWAPYRLARHKVGRTFQNIRLFAGLSVLENVEVGPLAVGVSRREARRRAWDLLQWMGLDEKACLTAEGLAYGDARRVGIMRALAMHPQYLLLDEPAAGLNEMESDELLRSISAIRDRFSCGIILIDHDMRLIMRLCDRIQVLDYGKTICIGTPAEVQADPAVTAAYLGTKKGKSFAEH